MTSEFARIPDDEEQIDIPFMVHCRLKRQALDRFGQSWTPAHDRHVANQLFKQGVISDSQRQQLLDKIHHNIRAARERNPGFNRFRLW